ncbi:mechanosensitive ion channel protein MscS [Candidatus Marinamargulisbacteria bacterium SCGC AAA071-K20]|nr:mechanosensitive ion channel protein MscS [Candidatus Marinamargulisbacteria bacterium SCGC AAA071-K20]
MDIWNFIKTIAQTLHESLLILDTYSISLGTFRLSIHGLLKIAIVVVFIMWGRRLISAYIHRLMAKVIKNNSNLALTTKIIDSVLYFIVVMIMLRVLGLNLTAFAVFGGAFGIGIGFGLQKITSNFISGLILLTEKSIEVGHLIELDKNIYGWVRKLSARYTLVETFDGKEVMIPNEEFIINRVQNLTFSNTKARIEIKIGVSYDSDIKKAKTLLVEAASEHQKCLQSPAPECYLTDYGDSSVNFILFFWISDISNWEYGPKSDVLFTIWEKFKNNQIKIPFPQRDIHIKTPIS